MRIWLVTVGEPLPEKIGGPRLWRTGLLARELAARGHEVTWWTSTVDHFRKVHFADTSERRPVDAGLTLQFLHGRLYRRNVSLARFRNHVEIAREFRRLAPTLPQPHVIACSYPTIELSLEAVRYARARAVPAFIDVRDLWPEEMIALAPPVLRPVARAACMPLARAARAALGGATGILAVSSAYLDWALQTAGRVGSPDDAVFTHGYPDPGTSGSPADIARARELGLDPGRRWVMFSGTFVGSIDLTTAIRAARELVDRSDVGFVFVGSGERDAEWRREAAGLDNVRFTGWLDREALGAVARAAWVGLGAYKPGALMSLTNKVFEYMGYGLPVVLCLPGEARRIVEEREFGVYYEPGDPACLARVLRSLLDDPARTAAMSAQARRVFEREYSAAVIYGRMSDFLQARAAGDHKENQG